MAPSDKAGRVVFIGNIPYGKCVELLDEQDTWLNELRQAAPRNSLSKHWVASDRSTTSD
jgi:hypothetical protein